MTLWELRQRISGDDYWIEGSDPEVNPLCTELKDEQVRFLLVRGETPDGNPREIIRLVPVPLKPEEQRHPSRSAFSTRS